MLMALLDWAQARQIGFSHLLDLGDMVDVDVGDVLDYLTREPDTQAVRLCLEWLTQARKFMSAARAAARAKPVIVLLAGQADDAVFEAAFRRAGMLQVRDLGELFGAVETLALAQPVYGDRLAILTNGSGIGALAVDTVRQEGGWLATLAPATVETLQRLLPARWSPGNPVDLLDDAPGERYGAALRVILQDPAVDAALLLYGPTTLVPADAVATAVTQQRERTGRIPCVFTAWLGARSIPSVRPLLTGHGVPCYTTPDGAVRALLNRVRYRRNQETLMETPPAISRAFTPVPSVAHDVVTAALADGRSRLTDSEAEQVLNAYQIPVVVTRTAADPDQAAAIAAELGGPIALKIQAAGLRHRDDVGGVALSLETPAVVRENAVALWQRIHTTCPEIGLSGFTVQPMIHRPQALQLAAGVRQDPLFGPVLWFGQGGPLATLIDDQAFALPPLNLHLAQELMRKSGCAFCSICVPSPMPPPPATCRLTTTGKWRWC